MLDTYSRYLPIHRKQHADAPNFNKSRICPYPDPGSATLHFQSPCNDECFCWQAMMRSARSILGCMPTARSSEMMTSSAQQETFRISARCTAQVQIITCKMWIFLNLSTKNLRTLSRYRFLVPAPTCTGARAPIMRMELFCLEFSKVLPIEGGEIFVPLTQGRPSENDIQVPIISFLF